ncbi:MAG: nitrophenyl compound nitroreductase subunit ArsF family protein [Dehalococcoidia bacterium]|jgi:hypothetical protein
MLNSIKLTVIPLLLVGTIFLGACSAPTVNPAPPAGQTPAQDVAEPADQPVSQPQAGENPVSGASVTDNATTVAEQPQLSPPSRVDVIYFHVNQRCVTCLCFEQHINYVIDTYFQDAIDSGKLTYRVLNIQKEENVDIARKYRAVGSQLFINVIVNGIDNIEDIQSIWSWKCPSDPKQFERKVRIIIEQSLEEVS